MATRCISPPDISSGKWSARLARPTRSRPASGRLERGLARGLPAQQQRQGDVLRGGQRRQQVEELEDEADAGPPQQRPLAVGQCLQVPALEEDLAAGRRVEGPEQVHAAWICPSRWAP